MRKILEKLFVVLLALTIVIWGGYHVFRLTQEKLVTETVFQSTVPRSLSGRGIAIREEELLQQKGSGVPRYIYRDATRVGIGQPVIEYYPAHTDTDNIQRIQELDDKIAALETAQNKSLNNYSSAPGISRDMREQFALLTQASTTGQCNELGDIRDEIGLLVNRREIAINKSDNFQPQIDLLKEERNELQKSVNLGNIQTVSAPVSGYFAKNSDGFESRLTPDSIEDLSIEEYQKLVETELDREQISDTSRMVTSSKWQFAVCVPSYQTEWLQLGQKANLTIDGSIQKVPARVSDILVENNNDTAVVIFYSDVITEDILNLRIADVTISFSQFTGLRINSSSIHFRTNPDGSRDRGVYVLESYVVKFKKIEPIYEEPSFILSKMNYADSADKDTVRLFDQVIVQGNDLYEGKIIQ